jgi:hypothetical protein
VLGVLGTGIGECGVLGMRRWRAAWMILDDKRSGMIVRRRRRILARKSVARASKRNDAGDDGAK